MQCGFISVAMALEKHEKQLMHAYFCLTCRSPYNSTMIFFWDTYEYIEQPIVFSVYDHTDGIVPPITRDAVFFNVSPKQRSHISKRREKSLGSGSNDRLSLQSTMNWSHVGRYCLLAVGFRSGLTMSQYAIDCRKKNRREEKRSSYSFPRPTKNAHCSRDKTLIIVIFGGQSIKWAPFYKNLKIASAVFFLQSVIWKNMVQCDYKMPVRVHESIHSLCCCAVARATHAVIPHFVCWLVSILDA